MGIRKLLTKRRDAYLKKNVGFAIGKSRFSL